MKRLFILAAFAAVAFGLKAEVSTTTYAIVPAVNATAVTAGTATTNTLDVSHYTGTGEIIAPYSTANTSCVFSVTLEGTNTTDGGWTVIRRTARPGICPASFGSRLWPPDFRRPSASRSERPQPTRTAAPSSPRGRSDKWDSAKISATHSAA